MSSQLLVANRVSQLESNQLDRELDVMIDNVVEELEIPSYSEEIKTILRLYIYTSTTMTATSPGMRVYNMNFRDATKFFKNESITSAPRLKLAMLTTINLVGSYLTKRCEMFQILLQSGNLKTVNIPWLSADNLIIFFKFINIINFLAFLRRGTYLSIPERILGLTPIFSDEDYCNNIQLNRTQMDFMYREMVWRVLDEFLTTVIPMINFDQTKNFLMNFTGLMPKLRSELTLSEKIAAEVNSNRCSICQKQPFNPYVIGCRHVFCYYCLEAKHSSDPSNGYVCMACKYRTSDTDNVRRHKVIGALH